MANTVSNSGAGLERLLFQEEFHGKESARLLEDAGSQTAVKRIVPNVSDNCLAVGTLEYYLMKDGLKQKGEHNEYACAYEDGRPSHLILLYKPPA